MIYVQIKKQNQTIKKINVYDAFQVYLNLKLIWKYEQYDKYSNSEIILKTQNFAAYYKVKTAKF